MAVAVPPKILPLLVQPRLLGSSRAPRPRDERLWRTLSKVEHAD
jgi:hypothetical protein